MLRKFQSVALTMLGLVVLAAGLSWAQTPAATTVPHLVHFAGVAHDLDGKAMIGTLGITFALYAEQSGGAPLWLETQNVQADAKGNYTVELGAASADGLPMDVFASGQARWLGVQISGQAEQPRILLMAVPYALKAADAETIGGLPASAFVRAAGGGGGQAKGAGPQEPAAASKTVKTNSPYGTANYLPLWTSASTIQNSNVFQSAAGNVGVATVTPGAVLDVNGTGNFRGLVTFASGQTFPGTGTITGVTAGTDLTGGGTSGNVTLNVDTTKIPQLNGNNTFAGTQTLTGTNSSGVLQVTNTLTSGMAYGVVGQTLSPNGYGVLGKGPTTGGFGVTGITLGGTALYGIDGAASEFSVGVAGQSGSSGGTAVFGQEIATSGATAGVLGTASSSSGYGVEGSSPNTGVYGVATAASGATSGVYGVASGSSSFGVQGSSPNVGVYGQGTGTGGIGVDGHGTAMGLKGVVTGTSGGVAGVFGQSNSPGANGGVFTGYNAPSGSGQNGTAGLRATGGTPDPSFDNGEAGDGLDAYGGNGDYEGSGDTGGYGVSGWGGGGDPVNGYDGVGGSFDGGDSAGIAGDGVDAYAGSGLAGSFSGDVYISGNLSKGGGSFKIDHPLDPANKYLYHSFVESPDMMNIYNGNVVLDANGEAVVDFPEWFGVLNRDFRYQLTCIGGFAPVYVAEEISDNRFKIAGGRPGLKVSWQVTGIRQDAWANAHRIPVEEEKEARLKGFYIHPELYGAPPEKQIEWARHPQMMKKMQQVRQAQQQHRQAAGALAAPAGTTLAAAK